MAKEKYWVRAVNDLGDYEDSEHNTEPSMTDPSCDEPIENLMARMMRGEILGSPAPRYDVPLNMKNEEAFAQLSPMDSRDFDLADAPVIAERGKKALGAFKKSKGVKTPDPSQKRQEGPVPVDSQAPKDAKQPEKAV